MTKKINFTVQELLEAGLADTTPKVVGAMGPLDEDEAYDYDTKVGATCAVGGVAQAMAVDPSVVVSSLNSAVKVDAARAMKIDKRLLYSFDEDETVGLADVIISFNDDTNAKKQTIFRRLLAFLTPQELAKKVRLA